MGQHQHRHGDRPGRDSRSLLVVPVSEIELELKHGSPAELFKIAHANSDIVPAQLDVKSKSERGYDLLENNPISAEKACDLVLVPGMSTGRAFTLIGRACLRQLVANEPATQRRNSEALHQMRIALRRLRAAISLFSDVVSDDRVAIVKAELKWLGCEFGHARDLDSFILDVLKPLRKQQPDEPGLVSIGKMFARERLKSYRRARDAVQSARFREMVIDTAEWIEAGPWNTSEDPLQRARRELPIEDHAAEQLSRQQKKLIKRGNVIGELGPEQLHKLRIQVKKARYAAEFFSDLYPRKKALKRREHYLPPLKQLQNSLGGFNDIMTRKTLCADVIAHPRRGLPADQNRRRAYAAGLIMGNQQAQIQKLLLSASEAYAQIANSKPFWK